MHCKILSLGIVAITFIASISARALPESYLNSQDSLQVVPNIVKQNSSVHFISKRKFNQQKRKDKDDMSDKENGIPKRYKRKKIHYAYDFAEDRLELGPKYTEDEDAYSLPDYVVNEDGSYSFIRATPVEDFVINTETEATAANTTTETEAASSFDTKTVAKEEKKKDQMMIDISEILSQVEILLGPAFRQAIEQKSKSGEYSEFFKKDFLNGLVLKNQDNDIQAPEGTIPEKEIKITFQEKVNTTPLQMYAHKEEKDDDSDFDDSKED